MVGVTTIYEDRRGAVFNVEIYAKNLQHMPSGQLKLEFDPSVIQMRDLKKGELLQPFLYEENLTRASEGEIQAAWAGASGVSGEGPLLTIEFRLLTRDAKSALTLSNVRLFDDHPREIRPFVLSGDVKPFNGKTENRQSPTVPPTKEWTVTVSTKLARESINRNTIFVLDQSGNKVRTNTTLTQSGSAIKITPAQPYPKGTYTLVITDQLRAQNGGKLNEPKRMTFTVGDQ